MRKTLYIGSSIGLLAGLFSVLGNLRQGDPHLVSVLPDLLGAIVAGGLVFAAVRWSVRTVPYQLRRTAARDIIVTAAIAGGLVMGLFTWVYLPSGSIKLAMFAAASAAFVVCIIGVTAVLTEPGRERHVDALRHSRS